jgi:ketosteroid isomerase-like protein
MNKNNVQTIREIYEAFGRGDVAAVLARVKETALWDFNVTRSDVPWHVPVTGPAEIQGFLGAFVESVTLHAFEPRHFIAAGDDVVAHLHLSYTIKKTGRRVDEEQLQWWSLADGRVTRLRHFEDTAQVLAAWRGSAA